MPHTRRSLPEGGLNGKRSSLALTAISPMFSEQVARETTVLIPAAGRVPEGVLALSNISNPAMIPVAGRPVIHWTMSYLRGLGFRKFVIAVARRGGFIEDFVHCAFGSTCEVDFITPSKPGGLGQTVLDLSRQVKSPRAMVVLGDTHFQLGSEPLPADEPWVLVSKVEESYRWCIARTRADHTVEELKDKERDLTGALDALIGVYWFPDAAEFRDAAEAAAKVADAEARPAEMKGVLEGVRKRRGLKAFHAAEWLDCGNPDRQAASHQALLQKREFNELSIDPVLGTITKRSRNVAKFVDEINYLRQLPADLQVLFPRVLDFSTDPKAPFVTLEYYGYPSLSDAFVFENVDPGIWERVFAHLKLLLTEGFMKHSAPLPEGAVHEMLVGKTRARLASLQGPPELAALVRHGGKVKVNGRELDNLPACWDKIEAAVKDFAARAKGSIIHGDLCFSNILYDLRSRICKLIDPRGSFGPHGVTGDARYDLGKLFHSVYGNYDFLVHDLFQVSLEGTSLTVDIRTRPSHRAIEERFEKVFFQDGTFARKDALLVAGLLFASMLPLHSDAPKRQLAMYGTALMLLDEALR